MKQFKDDPRPERSVMLTFTKDGSYKKGNEICIGLKERNEDTNGNRVIGGVLLIEISGLFFECPSQTGRWLAESIIKFCDIIDERTKHETA